MGTKEHLEGQPRRRRRKKSHRVYAFFVIVLGLAIIVLAVLLLFHVQKIEIEGNEYCADKEIVEAVQNDRFSTNSLYVVGKYFLGKGEKPACLDSMKGGFESALDPEGAGKGETDRRLCLRRPGLCLFRQGWHGGQEGLRIY